VAARKALSGGIPLFAVAMVAYIVFTRGASVVGAMVAVTPLTIGGAVAAHLLTLTLRTEAWRTVLRAAGGEELEPRAVHAANAGAFLAGTVQGQAALPTRVALLRRYGGPGAPPTSRVALADAPIVMFEVVASALLAAVASTAVGTIPRWAPWAMLAGALSILLALRVLYARFRGKRLAAGLGVIADPDLRNRLALIVGAFTAMAAIRTWIVLAGFDLPADPAHVCLVLFTMGAVGLLPLGIGTGPASMVAALGTTNIATATAAGMVVSAATIVAVLLYAGAVWTWRALVPAADGSADDGGAQHVLAPGGQGGWPDAAGSLDLAVIEPFVLSDGHLLEAIGPGIGEAEAAQHLAVFGGRDLGEDDLAA
jgi:hypothetical protein